MTTLKIYVLRETLCFKLLFLHVTIDRYFSTRKQTFYPPKLNLRLENNSANLQPISSQLNLHRAVSLRNMGAADAAAASDSTGPASSVPSMGSPAIQYSMVLEHLVGEKRPIKDLSPGVMGGLPVPPKSDEQKMIERGMESCAFKSVLACVGGKQPHTWG